MQTWKARNRITFQMKAMVEAESGGFTETWVDAFTVWGCVDFSAGSETQVAQQTRNPKIGKVEIRYRQDITEDMRITFKGRIFEILSMVNVEERNRDLVFTVKED